MSRLFVGRWFTTDIFAEFISMWTVITQSSLLQAALSLPTTTQKR
jgi:hypothetical protein